MFRPSDLPPHVPLAFSTETGGLLRLAVGLMQPFSEDRRNYTPLLNQLALYFQIRDDLINLASAEYMKAKSFCEDLTVRVFKFQDTGTETTLTSIVDRNLLLTSRRWPSMHLSTTSRARCCFLRGLFQANL